MKLQAEKVAAKVLHEWNTLDGTPCLRMSHGDIRSMTKLIIDTINKEYEVKTPVPTRAEFDSFFNPVEAKIVPPLPTPLPQKLPLPLKELSSLLDQAFDLSIEHHRLESRQHAFQVVFSMHWTGDDDQIEVTNMVLSPAKSIGKYARALAKFVDWDSSELIELASQRILKSAEIKLYRRKIKAYLKTVSALQERYAFDFEADILQGSLVGRKNYNDPFRDSYYRTTSGGEVSVGSEGTRSENDSNRVVDPGEKAS